MRNVITFCNLHDGPHLEQLTENRPLGCVTLFGRYLAIDFVLSNISNSNLNRVYILCENNSTAIRNHVGNGSVWITNTKTGYIKVVLNEKALNSPKFNTDIANVVANIESPDDFNCDYVLVVPPFFVNCMDYSKIIDQHEASGCDITLAYTHTKKPHKEYLNCDSVKLNKTKTRITGFGINSGAESENDISLEVFVFNRDTFVNMCKTSKDVSELYTIRRMVRYYVEKHLYKVGAYEFKDYTLPLLTFKDYVNHSFEMLNPTYRDKLLKHDWPIYTSTHNTPPTLYGPNAEVNNSFIANGSIIKGTVINSILSRKVIVEEGAVVKDSIIYSGSHIDKDVKVSYVLADDNVDIKEVKKLSGDKQDVLYIKQGAKV